MNSMIWITNFLFLPILSPTLNDKENSAADNEPVCLPFKVLFVWHTDSEYGHSFVQQKRLITTVIHEGLPEGTDISLLTVGAKMTTKLHFKKNSSDESWIDKLEQHVPGKSEKHGIPYLELSNAVYNQFDQDEIPKMAEEIFLFVSNKSRIDEKAKYVELLRKKKTYVIIYGKQTSGNVLTNLATDNRHVIGLGDSTDSINDAAKSILNLSCQDSELVCDTDKYWNENRCYTCTHLCLPEAWKPSQYCHNACPYYKQTPSDKDREVDHSTPPDKDREVDHSTSTGKDREVDHFVNDYSKIAEKHFIANTTLLTLIFTLLVFIFCLKCTSLRAKMLDLYSKINTSKRSRSSSKECKTTDAVQDVGHAPIDNRNENEVNGNARNADGDVADGNEYETKCNDRQRVTEHVKQDVPSTQNEEGCELSSDDEDIPRLPEPSNIEPLIKTVDTRFKDKSLSNKA